VDKTDVILAQNCLPRITFIEKSIRGVKIMRTKGTKIHLTIFKDFSEDGVQDFNNPEFKSFFRFTTQPNMIFQIRDSWHTFDDYIANKTKKYRDQYKRAKKKQKGLRKESYL
jgi:hypothetical protein